ncbi:hypothetical protein ES288_A11G277100v1 [Gossypium darwinii]|uniref:Uncharacterized protein n=2 Tax=Gossypium darwinii TaxID=34276 RepID=A0A5D2EPI5_GOSDA|nr:hypothetical protein ES288_A11G277100v1 [Gossypium darwinii]
MKKIKSMYFLYVFSGHMGNKAGRRRRRRTRRFNFQAGKPSASKQQSCWKEAAAAPPQGRLKRMETELAKMKAEMRDSAESLMAGKVEADQAEAKLQVLKLKLLAVKEIDAFLMGFL